ncbi:MAG: Wzz/FepE/Etk N-terminal domain-containing protein [Halieaceae bacterium]
MPNITEQNNGYIHHDFHDDEIDLFELMEGLWQQKWLIVAVTSVSAVVALAAVQITSPTYRAEAFIRTPLSSQVASIAESGVMELTPQDAIQRVEEELNSLTLRRSLFDRNISVLYDEIPASEDELNSAFTNRFDPALSVSTPSRGPKAKDEDRRTLSFENAKPAVAAAIVNDLSEAAGEAAKANLLEEFKSTTSSRLQNLRLQLQQAVANRAVSDKDIIAQLSELDRLKRSQLEDEISAVRDMAAKARQDEIIRLEEALAVAKRLKITEPTSLAVMAQNQSDNSGSVAFTAEISEGEDPVYLKGTRVLGAELAVLRARTSDDQQITELRELEKKLQLLANNREIESLQARENFEPFVANAPVLREEISKLEGLLAQNYDDVSLMRVDQTAMVPTKPIKPRKSLIVAAAVVSGGMLGVLIALIRNAAAARRERLVEE